MSDDDELWTVNQVRKATGLGRTTIYMQERAGRFPKKRYVTPRRIGYLKSEVLCWIKALAPSGDGATEGAQDSTDSSMPPHEEHSS